MSALRKLWPFQRPLGDDFRVVGVTKDRRNKAQLCTYAAIEQQRTDMALENRWREAARRRQVANLEERLNGDLLDPDPVFDDWRDQAADDAGIPRFGEI